MPESKTYATGVDCVYKYKSRYLTRLAIEDYMKVHDLYDVDNGYTYDTLIERVSVSASAASGSTSTAAAMTAYRPRLKMDEEYCRKMNRLNMEDDEAKANLVYAIKLLLHNAPLYVNERLIKMKIGDPDRQVFVVGERSLAPGGVATRELSVKVGHCVPMKHYSPDVDVDSLSVAMSDYVEESFGALSDGVNKRCKRNSDNIRDNARIIEGQFLHFMSLASAKYERLQDDVHDIRVSVEADKQKDDSSSLGASASASTLSSNST